MRERQYEGDYYITGGHSRREKPFFQALYEEVGFDNALELVRSTDLILWVRGVPPESLLKAWAEEVDYGKGEVDDKTRHKVFNRLEKMVRNQHRMATIDALKSLRLVSRVIEGNPEARVATLFNNLGNFANLAMSTGGYGKEKPRQTINMGNFILDAGVRPARNSRNLGRQLARAEIIEAEEVKVLPSGNGD